MCKKSESTFNVTVIRSSSCDWHIIRKLLESYSKVGYHTSFIGWDRLRQDPQCVVEDVESRHIMRGWGYSNWKLVFGLPFWGLKLLWYCLRLETDLIHVLDFDSALSVAIVSWLRGIPFIYDIQDNFGQRHNWPFPLNVLIRYLDDWTSRRASGILVTDENRIIEFFEKYRDKITVIPNCAPDLTVTCAPEVTNSVAKSEDSPLVVMALGNLSRQRGIDLLFDAVKELSDVSLLMAGRFVDASLENMASSMSCVDFRGWLPMEQALCLAFQADVIFTFYDPAIEINQRASSNKWYDAMMLAKPVLVNTELLKSSWVEQQGFGFLCPYGNVDALVKCLQYIRAHPQEAVQKGQRGRELYESKFNWPVMEHKILGIAQNILISRRGVVCER